MNSHHEEHKQVPGFWRSRYALGYLAIGGIAAYYLLTEHLAHVAGVLPYLLLLACPLMHIFMHRGHGHGGHGHHDGDSGGRQDGKKEGQQ